MNRLIVVTSFLVFLAIGCLLTPDEVFARSAGGHSAHGQAPVTSFRHHVKRFNHFGLPYYGYGYGYSYGADYIAPPPPPPPAENAVAETRRGCEPQSYKVPSSDGAEKEVTILRC